MKTEPIPRYRQIAADLAARLDRGEWPAGTRLPPVRQLARTCGVSPLTALQAYRWLEEQQRVVARERSGFYATGVPRHDPQLAVDPRPALPAPGTWVHIDDRVANLLTLSNAPLDVAFHMAEAEDALYPHAELARRLQHCLARDPSLIGAHLPQAHASLLRDGLVRLAAGWQLQLPADRLMLTNGSTEAIQLALRALTRPGDVVAVETPVYFGLLQTLESLGLKALEIPCTPEHGISLEALEFALRHGPAIRCLVVVPNFQNPTGALMPDDHKRRLIELARRHALPVIEDDVFGDLYYGSERPTPLKAWDRDGGIVYCSSFTKSFAPALRLGWVSGGRWHRRMERLKVSNSYVTSALLQATLADCLASGVYQRQAEQLRRHLARQSRALADAVLSAFPHGTSLIRPQGGMLLWVCCPERVDTLQLLHQALAHSVSFTPGQVFSAEPRFDRYLRLNVGHRWNDRTAAAVTLLGGLARRLAAG